MPDGRSDDASAAVVAAGHPFDLPVLSEVPELAATLELARDADRLQARLVDHVIHLLDHGIAEATTGVGLDQWLASVGRFTRSDRRMLATAARVLRRIPSVHAAFSDGRVSWSQVRTLVLKVVDLPSGLDDRIDHELAAAIAAVDDDGRVRTDPDALARVVTWVLAGLGAAPAVDDPAPVTDRLVLQPRLDGAGGRYWGEAGPAGFALLDAATDPGPVGGPTRDRFGDPAGPAATFSRRDRAAAGRADRLYERLAARPGGAVAPPTVICRVELSTLLGDDALPAQLLTTLAGGRMRVTADVARRLTDRHGADLRLVLLDDGAVVGVGRRRHQAPGWLRDATLALHDTCTEPGCLTAARVCDTDHARPFADGGRTDVDQLAPLCATANHRKERDGWTAAQTADGVRTWHHPRSGLGVRTLPAAWRPPPRREPPAPRRSARPRRPP